MATLTLLRVVGGQSMTKAFGLNILRQTSLNGLKPSSAFIPKQALSLTPVCHKRLYGPEIGLPSITKHWKIERYLAIGMLPLIPATVLFPNPVLDHTMTVAVILHVYWSMSAVFNDYIHGEYLPRIAHPLLLIFTILSFGSLCYLNYFDIGLGKAIKLLYSEL